MSYRQKEHLYLLVIILKNPINYKGGIINIKIKLIIIKIERKIIIISFNILPLKNNKVVLGIF